MSNTLQADDLANCPLNKKDEDTVTIYLSHYENIISTLDKVRREADFFKAQYESLRDAPEKSL